ncbi:hypothetical protein ACHQM5_020479 [Ranunculus cassubicifolius]
MVTAHRLLDSQFLNSQRLHVPVSFWIISSSSSEILFEISSRFSLELIELANSQKILVEEQSKLKLVLGLYDALSKGEVEKVEKLLDSDIEWWFHGPPCHQQHLLHLLTGGATKDSFLFVPSTATLIESIVLVEGFDQKNRAVSWVHAWTVNDNGVITQVREYFNTSLTVAIFDKCSSSSSISSPAAHHQSICWQSKLTGESVPGLVLAI